MKYAILYGRLSPSLDRDFQELKQGEYKIYIKMVIIEADNLRNARREVILNRMDTIFLDVIELS